jgi:hypothetical protein
MSRAGGYGMIGFYKSVAMGANLMYDSFFDFCLLFYGHDGMGLVFLSQFIIFLFHFLFSFSFSFLFISKHRGFWFC